MNQIKVGNAPKAVADDPEGENTGRTPVTVVLLKSADFQGAPDIHTQGRLINYDPQQVRDAAEGAQALAPLAPVAYENLIDYNNFAPIGAGMGPFGPAMNLLGMGNVAGANYPGLRPVIFGTPGEDGRPDSRRSPAIRAVFYDVEGDVPVRQDERSVLFGFTSNFPPMFEATRLRGSAFLKAAAVDTAAPVGAADLTADASEIPTPVAFEQASAPVTGIGTAAGSLGGGETVGTGGGGVGAGGFPGFGGLGGGVTGGGGSTGTSGSGQQAQQQQQQQPNQSNVVNVQQSQQQQQKQKQKQKQQQQQTNTNTGNVVPEPAAWASLLLGVPFLLLLLRRKKRPQAV